MLPLALPLFSLFLSSDITSPLADADEALASFATSAALFPDTVPQATNDLRTVTKDSSPCRRSCCSDCLSVVVSRDPGTESADVLREGVMLELWLCCDLVGWRPGLAVGSLAVRWEAAEIDAAAIFVRIFMRLHV